MRWLNRIVNVLRGDRVDRDIAREMSFHVAELTDELIAQGYSPEDAARTARRRFGNDAAQKDRTHDADVAGWLETFVADTKYALRSLRGARGYSLVIILSLALGIGANTAIFSLINAVMLKTLPVQRPEELVQLSIGERGFSFPNPVWEQLRDQQQAFSGIFAYSTPTFNLADGGEARPVNGAWVSGDFFAALGVRAVRGRLITLEDDQRGCPPIAVLSHGFWQQQYGGSPEAIGSTLRLDGHVFNVVGVAEQSFYGVEVGQAVQVYTPLCTEAIVRGEQSALDRRSTWFLRVMGRPAAGTAPERVAGHLKVIAPNVFGNAIPEHYSPEGKEEFRASQLEVHPAGNGASMLRMEMSSALIVLMVIVGLVLLIACANVANLLLARATVRQRELAIRLAIGSGRSRLVRQLLTESLVLSLLGAALGMLFAQWGSRLLVAFISTGDRAVWLDLSPDWRVLTFTTAVAIVTALLFGVAPAVRAMRVSPLSVLQSGGRSVRGGGTRFNLGKALVVSQIALSLVLLLGAGLLLRTFWTLSTMHPGFDRENILLATVDLRATRYEPHQYATVYRDITTRLRTLPGVTSASASQITPVSNSTWNDLIIVDGYTPPTEDDAIVLINPVSDGYFATLGIPLLSGRDFSSSDVPGAPKVAIVSETLAKKYFGTAQAVGRQFHFEVSHAPGPPVTVIGVVGDTKYQSLQEEAQPIAFIPLRQDSAPGPYMTVEVRSAAGPSAAMAHVRRVGEELDGRMSLSFKTMDAQLDEAVVKERVMAVLSGFFGALALLLAMIGLYGIMAYNVAQRRNEIGIRIALGSARVRVLSMVLEDVGKLVVLGLALGLTGAFLSVRLVQAFLYGVSATDPLMFAGCALLMAIVAGAAGAVPAWRAARLDPMTALRED
jgi:predicted permease